jgi:hypothetical protein
MISYFYLKIKSRQKFNIKALNFFNLKASGINRAALAA